MIGIHIDIDLDRDQSKPQSSVFHFAQLYITYHLLFFWKFFSHLFVDVTHRYHGREEQGCKRAELLLPTIIVSFRCSWNFRRCVTNVIDSARILLPWLPCDAIITLSFCVKRTGPGRCLATVNLIFAPLHRLEEHNLSGSEESKIAIAHTITHSSHWWIHFTPSKPNDRITASSCLPCRRIVQYWRAIQIHL